MSARVVLFPQARRVGFLRKLARRVDAARSERSAENIFNAQMWQQKIAMQNRGFGEAEIDAALAELVAAVRCEIARLRRGGAA